jgi:hypothetical protein
VTEEQQPTGSQALRPFSNFAVADAAHAEYSSGPDIAKWQQARPSGGSGETTMRTQYLRWIILTGLTTIAMSSHARTLTPASTTSPGYFPSVFHSCFENQFGGIQAKGNGSSCAGPNGLQPINSIPLMIPLPMETAQAHTFQAQFWGVNLGTADPYCTVFSFGTSSTSQPAPPAGSFIQSAPVNPGSQNPGFVFTNQITFTNLGTAEAHCILQHPGQGIRAVFYAP